MKSPSDHNVFFSSSTASNTILFFLLLIRLVDHYLVNWIFTSKAPYWFNFFYIFSLYILTIILLLLNKNDLINMNINYSSERLVIAGGVLLFFYIPPELGLVSIIELGIVISAVMAIFHFKIKKVKLDTSKDTEYPLWFWILIAVSIGLACLPDFLYPTTAKTSLSAGAIFQSFFLADLPGIVFEEVLFRGSLVAYLRKHGFQEYSTLAISTILFWIAHHKFLLLGHSYSFWFPLPLLSLAFGIAALKSKSLTPSIAAHFLFNFTTAISIIIYR